MRTPEDIAKSVLARRDMRIEETEKRKKAVIKTVSGICSCLCVGVIVLFLLMNTNSDKQEKRPAAYIQTETDSTIADNTIVNTEPPVNNTSETDSENSIEGYAEPEITDNVAVVTANQKPAEPESGFEIPIYTNSIYDRSDVITIDDFSRGGEIDSSLIICCKKHWNPYFHYIPNYLREKVFFDDYIVFVSNREGNRFNCGYTCNIISFIILMNFTDEELTDWYYLHGGYYLYDIPLEMILSRDEESISDYYAVQNDNEGEKTEHLCKLLSEEEIKRILLDNLYKSESENDKRAYNILTENGSNLTGYNFSIADFLFESDYTVNDIIEFIEEYKAVNSTTRTVFDYDFSIIDEANRTVAGAEDEMYPCEVDALMHR